LRTCRSGAELEDNRNLISQLFGHFSLWWSAMVRASLFCTLTVFVSCAGFAFGQSAQQDFTYTITTSPSWTDTGVDLQTGDTLQIAASATQPPVSVNHAAVDTQCDPQGMPNSHSTPTLPLPSAPSGALIAQLQRQGAIPILIGRGTQVHIDAPGHLFLGINAVGALPCQANFWVKVHRVVAASSGASTDSSSGKSESRAEQLKSQLASAAQIFVQGQFGVGSSTSGNNGASSAVSGSSTMAPAAALLTLSPSPLDGTLRRDIDGLPRRVNDQFKNFGDMVNFVIIGSQQNMQTALAAANWHPADVGDEKAVLGAVEATLDSKDYLQMPMSTLYLFGRPQDFGYEMAEPIAMVASRHHFRIWKAPFTWRGQSIWIGAGTHDVGFAKDKRNGRITHKIDPKVDGERDNIGSGLQKAGKVRSLWYYLPPNPVQEAKNATGDGYQSDGRVLVILLQ
jgi:hypothetical protein